MGYSGHARASTPVPYGTTNADMVRWLTNFPPEAKFSVSGTPGDRNEGMQYSVELSWAAPALDVSGKNETSLGI